MLVFIAALLINQENNQIVEPKFVCCPLDTIKPAEEVDAEFLKLYDAVREKNNADTVNESESNDTPSKDVNLGRGS